MSKDEYSIINQQKSDVFDQKPNVELKQACSVGSGILRLSSDVENDAINRFKQSDKKVSFFIPASGTGSRMFKFLFDYIETSEETDEARIFFKELKRFALYKSIPVTVREKIGNLQHKYIAEYLLSEDGMNYSDLPKGLIPFHEVNDKILNPFQEQVLQAQRLMGDNCLLQFTIQEGYEKDVRASINKLGRLDIERSISFSYQDKSTDAYCFTENKEPYLEHGTYLRRPAGHGALIGNLNAFGDDVVLIKNIDNIQHFSKSKLTVNRWQVLTGLLLMFKSDLRAVMDNYTHENLVALNEKYDFLSPEQLKTCDEVQLKHFATRPSRVCGMVKNEGAPGGGPFWIKDNGSVTKQIIEKVQISSDQDQQQILKDSSHFNPVFIALSKTDVYGSRLDLNDFVDHSKSLVVQKPHKGIDLYYRELPGLWNGAMSDWNTLFVEIPSEIFSPVKSVLDLLSDAHCA